MKDILKGGRKMENLTFQELARKIVDAIQEEIAKITDFDNGAIRLLFISKSRKGSRFLGGFGKDCEIDLGFPVKKSADITKDAITWDLVTNKGCVAYDIFYTDRVGISDNPPPKHHFRLYVAVSGAESEEDEQCALVAGNVLQQWCDTDTESDGFGHYGKCFEFKGPE